VRYRAVERYKDRRLRLAFERFMAGRREGFERFKQAESGWLGDWALYRALRDRHQRRCWADWEVGLRSRRPASLDRARRELQQEIVYHQFVQFVFALQWGDLRRYAARRGVGLIGDIPIFVSHDSADVWGCRQLFRLDRRGRPAAMAGVPPDYFSSTGQLWGHPLYRWQALRRDGYGWWLDRLRSELVRFDALRLDHFIGFTRVWAVPAGSASAVNGHFEPGPGADFLRAVMKSLGRPQLIAEDLGVVTDQVRDLRDAFGLPGIKVLQFGFGDAPEHLPHNWPRRAVATTGTHDNDTIMGWYRGARSAAQRAERERARRYLGVTSRSRDLHWSFVRLVLASVADTAVLPVQDLLGLGSAARMNRPARPRGNWRWRVPPGCLSHKLGERLLELTRLYGRLI
jgi:4-alpha-glucanotransferase